MTGKRPTLDVRFFDAYDLEVTAQVPGFVSRPATAHAAANYKDVENTVLRRRITATLA
jgi:hypothetical protein